MNTLSRHAEVWVVHEHIATLYRHRGDRWAEELQMPFSEFAGSASALSSFSLPETQVFFNVGQDSNPTGMQASKGWVGMAVDPPRLLYVTWQLEHNRQLKEIRLMGKKALVISTARTDQFEAAIQLTLLKATEVKHLQQHMSSKQSKANSLRSTVLLALRLWIAPARVHQINRLVAVGGLLLGMLLTHGILEHQNRHQEMRARLQAQAALKQQHDKKQQLDFTPWVKQVQKFGRANRANLQKLTIAWSESGGVQTQAHLARDRKRVPKGCKLLDSTRAQCSINQDAP